MGEGISFDGSSLHDFLIGPLFLYEDLVSAAVPGIIFLLLLLTKHVGVVQDVLAMPYLGYKSRIVAALLLAYVVGKVFQIPGALALSFVEGFDDKKWLADKTTEEGPLYDLFVGPGQRFVVGAIMGLFLPPFNGLQGWMISRANVGFYLNTGLALIIVSFVPGDGTLITVERCGGAALLLWGCLAAIKLRKNIPAFLGFAIGNHVISSAENYEERITTVLRFVLGRKISALRAELHSSEKSPNTVSQEQGNVKT
jgi:hypothetical protein